MILTATPADAGRWTAVLERDAAADGRFVYAVASTRIYCRPSCPSRRPSRRQVSFFPTPDAAEAQGYRACRRCHPREVETDAVQRVRQAQHYLDTHLDETVTLDRLGSAVGLSPYHLQRTFKRHTGMSPRAYASARRMPISEALTYPLPGEPRLRRPVSRRSRASASLPCWSKA